LCPPCPRHCCDCLSTHAARPAPCPRSGTLDTLIHRGGALDAGAPRGGGRPPLEPLKLLPILRSVARGVLHLHTRSPPLLHRDLKPANVFVGHGLQMKVGDLGHARPAVDTRPPGAAAAGLRRTLTPGAIGTAAYAAPELLAPPTPRAGEAVDTQRLLKVRALMRDLFISPGLHHHTLAPALFQTHHPPNRCPTAASSG
jgi:serine/threonine protein kinase